MAPPEIEHAMAESPASLVSPRTDESDRRFANLRGVRWRVNLGVLPSAASSIDDFRRVTADSRRRYAYLRRRILIDPHVSKDGNNSPDLSIDNPLSQNPDSTWGRFFRNAELEKTVDQDLSRLYPEHGSYFQAPGFQGMLRRILLLWCLKHPEHGYKQGMHELLAPLLYVLHVDVERLSEVRKNYEDHFTDRFDGLSFEENDVTYNFDFKKFLDSIDDEIGSQGRSKKIKSLDELDPEIQSIVMLSDAYGAEGELGVVLSEKFMEHDAYCMFDALMNGSHGCVAISDFFAYSPARGSHTGLPPVLEACAGFYHLLSVVDSSLHSHLVELGVEPQYFGLRWLRVLFGREFSLQDLLVVWDEVFSADNNGSPDDNGADTINHTFKIFDSPRGALISGMAVSMILYLRSSLLATENATSCLQKLLNFPENIDLNKIIEKAKSLQALALDADVRSALSVNGVFDLSGPVPARANSLTSDSVSPKSPLIIAPKSYWEEKWRVLHKAEEEEEQRQSDSRKQSPTQKKRIWSKVKKLLRTETDSPPSKTENGKRKVNSPSVRRSLLEDLSRQLDSDPEDANERDKPVDYEDTLVLSREDSPPLETEGSSNMGFHSAGEESIASGHAPSEENSSIFSDPTSPLRDSNYNENDSESSTASNFSPEEIEDSQRASVDSPLPVSSHPNNNESPEIQSIVHETSEKSASITKERKLLPGKFQWFWKFGRNLAGEESSDRNGFDATSSKVIGTSKSDVGLAASGSISPQASSSDMSGNKGETDQNVMNTLRNLGHSMLEHIQVIESVFQQERGQTGLMENLTKTNLVGKGQVTALTALKELRKISNLLSEM
ncbi:PREDICTED: TBC1 domain family member 5 [Tarenaya hassleriana]|uniref:TBC1 domain family member 5 n=1 Tax=Tarenaya hassleriana TaxID=28532 RepID=UPI00053C71EC|nr:PREDICTED: TBC1 domain family member 5 [Tarenaya hassleriana]